MLYYYCVNGNGPAWTGPFPTWAVLIRILSSWSFLLSVSVSEKSHKSAFVNGLSSLPISVIISYECFECNLQAVANQTPLLIFFFLISANNFPL